MATTTSKPPRRQRRGYWAEYRRNPANTERLLLVNAKSRAKRSGLDFDLVLGDLHIPHLCPALGIPLFKKAGRGGGPNSPSLDRIDSSRGYVKGNVVVVSWRANSLKKDATPDELERIASFFRQLSKS